MFGKLVKYEMKSMMKIFLLAWGAILVVALINGINLSFEFGSGETTFRAREMFSVIPIILYGFLVCGIIVMALVFVIQRFYKGLLGDEGYLMFTLPTTARKLILAKSFSAALVVIISGLVGMLSVFLMVLPSMGAAEWKAVFDGIQFTLREYPITVPAVLLGILMCILSAVTFIYQVYASVAIGHLSAKHRMLFSVLAFIGIMVVLQTITILLGTVGIESRWVRQILDSSIWQTDKAMLVVMGIVCLEKAVMATVYHVITEYILRKKLNLE